MGKKKSNTQCFNVIDAAFFQVPIEMVCIPGLHITLGVYLKMFWLLESYCLEVDTKMAAIFCKRWW